MERSGEERRKRRNERKEERAGYGVIGLDWMIPTCCAVCVVLWKNYCIEYIILVHTYPALTGGGIVGD